MKRSQLIIAILTTLIIPVHAEIGWTLQDCIKHYGKDVTPPIEHHGEMVHNFHFGKYYVDAYLSGNPGIVAGIQYRRLDLKELTIGEIARFLRENGSDLEWTFVKGVYAFEISTWQGNRNGKTILSAWYASFEDQGFGLSIRLSNSE
jgi:hypothetical protein